MSINLDKIATIVRSARGEPDEVAYVHEQLTAELPAASWEDRNGALDDYVFALGFGPTWFEMEIEALRTVSPLKLTVAPQISGVFSTDHCQLLVKRYAACPGERLHRVYDSDVRFDEAQRTAFRHDLERLADIGYMHAAAHRNVGYWLYGETSKTIVLRNWEMLRPLEERSAIFESVDHYLSQHAA